MRSDVTHFHCQISDKIAFINLMRPYRKNPLTFDSYAELRDWFQDLKYADDVHAVVFGSTVVISALVEMSMTLLDLLQRWL